ncbi:hypothetical protein Cdeb_01505 [Caldibacillus debilis GB1]|jgi:hypothetical protein|uniref:Uncharacterized protein n=1 Tax=Caldibacillus debilis GB1 TaxID=1339248 RepID=A0A420VDY8_9BACI|nr:hypothetical protein Cdeb_01505 [Caldibacillus debilis GB1]
MKVRPAASDEDGGMQTVDKRSANAFAGQPAGDGGRKRDPEDGREIPRISGPADAGSGSGGKRPSPGVKRNQWENSADYDMMI